MSSDTQSVENSVLSRIYGRGRGAVFTPMDFLDLGSRRAIDLALHRITKAGTIRRIARGLYDYPKTSVLVGILPPSTDAIAKALAGPEALRLQPAGGYAANLLGLSEQVPARVVFLTDARSRTVRVGRQTIILKQTTPRNMKLHNRVSGLVVQALRHLGRKHVGAEQIATLRQRLTEEQRREIEADAKWAPGWVAEILRAVARQN
jgi:hypothetical protein